MILDCHHLLFFVAHASAGAIVQVDVRHFYAFWQRVRINSVVMILAGDLNATAFHMPNGMVPAVVPKLELESARAECLANHLMAHADSKGRQRADDLLSRVNGVGNS